MPILKSASVKTLIGGYRCKKMLEVSSDSYVYLNIL